jgi:hypothetical protein
MTLIFDGTNYDIWKTCMLKHFLGMDPNIERILDMGFSPPKDPQSLSLEEKKNTYLNSRATNMLFDIVSNAVIFAIMPFYNAHEFWTKIQKKYDVSNTIEDDCIPSISPTCGKTQGNDKVSGDEYCNVDSELKFDYRSSLSHCNASSLDLNTSSTTNDLHACVDSPCISCAYCLNKSHDDMFVTPCCHDINASSSYSCCMSNNVEETRDSIGQDMVSIGASSHCSSSSIASHICLMARSSKVTPTLETNISSDDENEDNEEEFDDVASLIEKSEMMFHSIRKNKIACSYFYKILAIATESNEIIEEHENTIFKM